MSKRLKGAIFGFFFLAFVVSLLSILPGPTPVNTETPTSTKTFFRAKALIVIPCRSGTDGEFEQIATILQDQVVMVIAKDKEGPNPDWLLVRPGDTLDPDCWIETKYVTSDDIDFLATIATPLDPTATPTSTPTFTVTATSTPTPTATATSTVTPTSTRSFLPYTPTPTQNQNEDSGPSGQDPTQTKTPTSPPTATRTQPPPTPTRTSTPTPPPPTATNTPSGPRECNDDIDNDGDGKVDYPDDPQCNNQGDNDESW